MRFPTLLAVAGVLGLVFGAGFFVAPVMSLSQYGMTTDPAGFLMTRFFGAALAQLGLILLLVRNVQEPAAQQAIARGGAVGSLVGLAVAVLAQYRGLVNALGWSTVAIYGLLFLAYAWFAFGRRAAP